MTMTKRPEPYMKYQSIKADLHKELQNGTYMVGHKLPSERSLAEKFGASVMTVRQALSLMSQEGMIERVPGRGSFVLDPNPSVPLTQALSCSTVALLTIDNPNSDPFRSDATANTDKMIRALSGYLEEQGKSLIIAHTTTRDLSEGRLPMALENNLVGGVFLYSLVEDYHIQYIQNMGLPVVVIGNRPVYLPVSRVSVDYRSISYEVTKALLNASSETVHFLTAPFILYYEHQILEGYLQACRDADRDTSVRMYDYTQKDAARLRHAISNVDDNSAVMLNYNIGYLMGDSDQVFPLDLRNLRAAAFGTSYGINPSILRRLNVRDSDKDSSGEAAVELMEEAIAGAAPREIVLSPEISTYEEEGLLRINVDLVRNGSIQNK